MRRVNVKKFISLRKTQNKTVGTDIASVPTVCFRRFSFKQNLIHTKMTSTKPLPASRKRFTFVILAFYKKLKSEKITRVFFLYKRMLLQLQL